MQLSNGLIMRPWSNSAALLSLIILGLVFLVCTRLDTFCIDDTRVALDTTGTSGGNIFAGLMMDDNRIPMSPHLPMFRRAEAVLDDLG